MVLACSFPTQTVQSADDGITLGYKDGVTTGLFYFSG